MFRNRQRHRNKISNRATNPVIKKRPTEEPVTEAPRLGDDLFYECIHVYSQFQIIDFGEYMGCRREEDRREKKRQKESAYSDDTLKQLDEDLEKLRTQLRNIKR